MRHIFFENAANMCYFRRNEAILAGEILRNKREDLGLEIREIAEKLKISEDYLTAIENDVIEKLPVPVYTMGYIRSYAAFVGIDADPIVQFYRERLSQPQPSTIVPVASSKRKGHKLGYLVVVAVIALAAFLLFPHLPGWKDAEFPRQYPVAEKLPAGTQVRRGPAGTKAVGHGEEAGVAAGDIKTVSPGKSAVADAGRHTLSVTADGTTWVAVSFENGRKEELLLRSGQSKEWDFSGKASLRVGNAAGLSLRLDGKDLGKAGAPGEVKNLILPAEEAGE